MRRLLALLAWMAATVGVANAADDGVWVVHPDYPRERVFPVWLYDPIEDRAVLTTGQVGEEVELTWTLGFRGGMDWDPRTSANEPVNWFYGTVACYEPPRRRVVITNGEETWALRLDDGDPHHWRPLDPSGLAPSRRAFSAGFYDPERDQLVMFGGLSPSSAKRNDVRALILEDDGIWDVITVQGPAPKGRYGHTAIHDRRRDRAVFFGGTDDTTVFAEVWTVNFTGAPQWTHLATTGTPPPGLVHAAAVWDSVGDRLVVFGGTSTSGYHNGTWALDLATHTWQFLAATTSPPAWSIWHGAFHDPIDDRMVVTDASTKVWALNLRGAPQWTELAAPLEPRMQEHTTVLDASRNRLLVYGPMAANPFWAWSLEEDAWTPLPVPPAGSRGYHTAILDLARDRMIVFGGRRSTALGDLWEYSLSSGTWTELVQTGTLPGPRYDHVAIWDPRRDRMIVYGGSDDRTFALDLATHAWTEVLTPTNPGVRAEHAAVYDARRDRMLVFGGQSSQRDTWALSLSGAPEWTLLSASGGPPVGNNCSAIIDPVRDRLVVQPGGYLYEGGAVHALDLSGPPTWTQLHAAGLVSGRTAHTTVYEPRQDRMILYGGIYHGGLGYTEMDPEVHSLVWGTPAVDVPEVNRPGVRLLTAVLPNPTRGLQTFELTLSEATSDATLEVLSVNGRRMWSTTVQGSQRVRWDGRDRFARPLDPGVYWVVVRTAAGQRDSRRIVRLH